MRIRRTQNFRKDWLMLRSSPIQTPRLHASDWTEMWPLFGQPVLPWPDRAWAEPGPPGSHRC